MSLLTSLVSVLPLSHHLHGSSVTPSRCSALSCAFLFLPLSSHTNHNHPPSSPPCAACGRVRVRTCRLPLNLGQRDPIQRLLQTSPMSHNMHLFLLVSPGHQMFLQPCSRGVKGSRHHKPLPPRQHPGSLSVITCLLTTV